MYPDLSTVCVYTIRNVRSSSSSSTYSFCARAFPPPGRDHQCPLLAAVLLSKAAVGVRRIALFSRTAASARTASAAAAGGRRRRPPRETRSDARARSTRPSPKPGQTLRTGAKRRRESTVGHDRIRGRNQDPPVSSRDACVLYDRRGSRSRWRFEIYCARFCVVPKLLQNCYVD